MCLSSPSPAQGSACSAGGDQLSRGKLRCTPEPLRLFLPAVPHACSSATVRAAALQTQAHSGEFFGNPYARQLACFDFGAFVRVLFGDLFLEHIEMFA